MPARPARYAALVRLVALIAVACPAGGHAQPIGPEAHTKFVATTALTRNATTADFDGVWSTTFGELTIKQTGMMASGEYMMDAGKATITGKVSGQKFTFTYQEPKASGEGWFEMADDGQTFKGQWRAKDSDKWAEWNGKRGKGETPPPASAPATATQPIGGGAPAATAITASTEGLTGLWQTSFGPMRLSASGTACSGVYLYNGMTCTITGTVKEGTLTFTYDQPDGEKGEGAFTLGAGHEGFTGTWKAAKNGQGSWEGRRLRARAGITHLVVLEANWETSLNDREYSYGDMLRTFFQRVPSVVFHHRFVHDEADVRRFAAEAAFLPEPVVLYFSSHGSDKGLSMGGKTVPPEAIAAAIKGATNIKLLHFGACEVMAGDGPQRIASAVGGTFPISGYANTADWGGSAIVDLTYLVLVLEHGKDPAAAIEETRKSVSFASTSGANGTIAPSALRILVPGQGMK